VEVIDRPFGHIPRLAPEAVPLHPDISAVAVASICSDAPATAERPVRILFVVKGQFRPR